MKRVCFYVALLLLLSPAIPVYAGGGNGAPSGAHYNLNIIGVPQGKSADMTENNGHRIFVNLEGKTKIMLGMGDFRVMDANGTDGDGAMFLLPTPDPDGDGVTTYSVYARALGKPGQNVQAVMNTCLKDPNDDDPICSTYTLTMVRKGKGTKFTNVSRDLLYIYADIDGDGVPERHPLFADALKDYFWDYTNDGLKVAQLRFYEVPTEVPAP